MIWHGPQQRRRFHLRWVVAWTMALVLVAAACGDSDDEPGAAPDPGTGGTEATEGAEDGPAQAGGTLRYGYYISPTRWDPHRSSNSQDIRLHSPVYDRLIHYSETGELIPGLATEWSFSDDGMALELQLREGVTFHDGEPFDAEAVKANIERGQTVEGSSIASDLADIASVEVVDEHTVVLNLTQPNSMLPGMLSSRAGAMVSPAAFDDPDLDFAPVGAGPYQLVDYRIDDLIVLERFADHWDTEAGGPDRIEIRILADDVTRLNALQAGDVDLIFMRGSQIPDAEAQGFTVETSPALTYQMIFLNRAKSEFGDQRVRQALNHAIDRQAFTEVVLGGAGEPVVQPFPPFYFAHNDEYPADHYAYDPERARELLAEAGLPDGFSFEMLVPSLEVYVTGSQVVQAQLAEIGVNAEIRQVEPAQTGDIFYGQQAGDALLAQFGGRPDPQLTMDTQFSDASFANPGRHTTPEFMELTAATKATTDPDERLDNIHAMVAEVVEQAFQVPIAADYVVVAHTDAVDDVVILPAGEIAFQEISVNG